MEFINDLKIIWSFLSRYKRLAYAVFAMAILSSAVEVAVPYIYGRVIDSIIAKEPVATIVLILIGWLTLSFIKDWSRRFATKEGAVLGTKCSYDLITRLNAHMLRLSLQFHKTQKTGKLASKYIRAADYLESIIRETLFWFGPTLITIVIVCAATLVVQWKIAAILIIIIFIYLFVTLRKINKISDLLVCLMDSYEKSYAKMYDAVVNIQAVKSNIREEYEEAKTRKAFNTVESNFKKFNDAWANLDFYQQTIASFGTVLLFGSMVALYLASMITLGQIVMFVGYMNLIFPPLKRISHHLDHFKRSMGLIKRAMALFDEETEPYGVRGRLKLEKVRGEVVFENVSFYYHKTRPLLENITFKAAPGQVIALVGESGVGKSTLVDLISRYIMPSAGKIFLDEIDLGQIELEGLREQIAIVPQEVSLFNDTIRNNIIYAKLDASEAEIWEAVKAANAEKFINSFPNKLDQEVGERGVKLSTGQKQRIAIARAILKNPKILILDEATSALDSKSELLVQGALKKLIKGRTTFVIAHRLSTIMHADKILVLSKGRIAEEGNHEELIKAKGMYWKFFIMQSLGEVAE